MGVTCSWDDPKETVFMRGEVGNDLGQAWKRDRGASLDRHGGNVAVPRSVSRERALLPADAVHKTCTHVCVYQLQSLNIFDDFGLLVQRPFVFDVILQGLRELLLKALKVSSTWPGAAITAV